MVGIIIKNYQHFNRALNKHITSRKHYEEEMAKGGFVSYEKGCELAEKARASQYKPYDKLSDKATELIKSASNMKDRKGKIEAGNRLIEGMKAVGVNFNVPDWCPKHYREM